MTIRLGIVGLGRVRPAHASALDALGSRFEVVVGCDPNPAARARETIPTVATLDELLEVTLDAVVVAVPNEAHAEVATVVLERGLPVLLEKPAVLRLDDLEALYDLGCVQVVLHAGFSPDVTWMVTHRADLEAAHGPIVLAESIFEERVGPDPGGDRSWFDLGINALSALDRVVGGLSGTRTGLRFATGTASVTTAWDTGINHKRTTLHFEDGTTLLLDHSHHRVRRGERTLFARSVPKPRLSAHYPGVYRAWSRVLAGAPANRDTARRLHRILLGTP